MRPNMQSLTVLAVAVVLAMVVGRASEHMSVAQRLVIGAMFFLGGMLAVAVFGSPFEDRE